MELTIEQALQQAVTAHREGKLEDADRLYRAILQSQPTHPDANHNLGVLAVSVNKADAALPLFKTALEANPKIEQFWLSYIDALIKENQFDNAQQVLEQAKKQGVTGEKLNILRTQLVPTTQVNEPKSASRKIRQKFSEKRKKLGETKRKRKNKKQYSHGINPTDLEMDNLLNLYQNGRYDDAENLAISLAERFPKHPFSWKVLGALLKQTGRITESLTSMQKSLQLAPQDAGAHSNLGVTLQELGRLEEAEASNRQAIALKPDFAEAHSNLGDTLKELGRLKEAEASYTQAIALKPDYAEAHYNLGIALQEQGKSDEAEAGYRQAIALKPGYALAHSNLGVTLQELGRLKEAVASYTRAIALKPDFADAFWNLAGTAKSIQGAEHWIDKCLFADATYQLAKLTKAALRFYQGDRNNFDELMQSELKQHPYMRSFSWIFNLPYLPGLYFNKWDFFDAAVKKSIISKAFYEFGVFRGSSFKYLIKSFKKGYGFDTFTGLPEDWDVGDRIEKKGSYSSDGNVPKITGGEFIVGKFEDSLPVFFSESRPMASLINFDADLYSSTICALNFSKKIIDKDTILIFDELIMHESWEQDEIKALNEFCSINNYSYEVIAISFFTKQVAVKLIGI